MLFQAPGLRISTPMEELVRIDAIGAVVTGVQA
jgi:hypothetical protein